jgi:glyoxylase-like metal-dependent hydrolase (beta-lactamase superfamily II)
MDNNVEVPNPASYHFTVGTFICTAVNDGTLAYQEPARDLFPSAPSEQLAQALLRYNIQLETWHEFISPLPCLVIQTGKNLVLVDTGLGHEEDAPNAGRLLKNLQAEGIRPGEIDTVILTHAHGDHIGGNTNPDGSAAFSHARYVMRKEEWDFWTSQTTLAQPENEWMTPFVYKQLVPLFNRFELLEQDVEIVPGIHSLFAPGHTPGHMALSITSGGEKLLCVGDAVAHPIHLEQPTWYFAPDCQHDQALRTRRRLLEVAAAEQALVFVYHFDFPGLGHVHEQQEAWQWDPIAMGS